VVDPGIALTAASARCRFTLPVREISLFNEILLSQNSRNTARFTSLEEVSAAWQQAAGPGLVIQ
jgi:hypothetical protein